MADTTDAILTHLSGMGPREIELTLRNLERMSVAQAEEAGALAARQKAADEKMSLAEVQVKLERANAAGDLEGIRRWQPLHQEKLKWVTDQMQANEQARIDKVNQPVIEKRQARRSEILQELDLLSKTNVSSNLDRIGALQDELGVLA